MTGRRRRKSTPRFFAIGAAMFMSALLSACSMLPTNMPSISSQFPPRPAAIDIAKIDPCAVLSDSFRKDLGVDAGTPRTANVGTVDASRGCTWVNTEDGFGYNFQTIPTSAADALKAPGSVVQEVRGFGAVRNSPDEYQGPGIPPACQLTIDVNDRQAVRVQVQSSETDNSRAEELLGEACKRSTAFAADAMSTILSQQR